MYQNPSLRQRRRRLAVLAALALAAACSDNDVFGPQTFTPTPVVTFAALKAAVDSARRTPNGGFNLDMWGTVVDRSGVVVAVVYTGAKEGDQWQGSRVISAQKANTANAFSLPGLALSTANLYAATQPGGTLFGLQEANPIDPAVAYGGNTADYGTVKDYMVGKKPGGTNVFGGGFALYDSTGAIVGGVGVSGDASCADHNIAWKVRYLLKLDHVPAGVADAGKDDNIIYDIGANGVSASGFGHPTCGSAMTTISNGLPTNYPIGH
jgi:uncharacterized protein GlcG (DUF336 family)